MFALGVSESVAASPHIVRDSIVWIGAPHGDDARALHPDHPLGVVLHALMERGDHRGTWVLCRGVAGEGRRPQIATHALVRSGWRAELRDGVLRGSKALDRASPWPSTSPLGWGWPQDEVLLLGSSVDDELVASLEPGPSSAVPAESLILSPPLLDVLHRGGVHAICLGRTHTDQCPGLAVYGPPGLDVAALLGAAHPVITHSAVDAGWAWSHRRRDL